MTYGARVWVPSRIITRAAAQEGERVERRRFARVKMELPARYMTPDGEEHDCVTVDFSPVGVRFQTKAPSLPSPGANIVAYVRDLGRLQGQVLRNTKSGFVIEVSVTDLKLERLSQKIAWLKPEGAPDRRLFPRVAPRGALIPIRCADGRNEIAPIVDISEGGVAFRTGIALKLGETVEIGDQTGVIVRVSDDIAAAKFL